MRCKRIALRASRATWLDWNIARRPTPMCLMCRWWIQWNRRRVRIFVFFVNDLTCLYLALCLPSWPRNLGRVCTQDFLFAGTSDFRCVSVLAKSGRSLNLEGCHWDRCFPVYVIQSICQEVQETEVCCSGFRSLRWPQRPIPSWTLQWWIVAWT